MQKTIFSFLLLVLITSCASSTPAVDEATRSTEDALPSATITLTPVPTATHTPEPTATKAPPEVFFGKPASAEQFPLIDHADVPALLSYLRAQPSGLTLEANSQQPVIGAFPPGGHYKGLFVRCQEGATCAAVASYSVSERGARNYYIVWEILNADGSSGFIRLCIGNDGEMKRVTQTLKDANNAYQNRRIVKFFTEIANETSRGKWFDYFLDDPQIIALMAQWEKTGNMPKQLESFDIFGDID